MEHLLAHEGEDYHKEEKRADYFLYHYTNGNRVVTSYYVRADTVVAIQGKFRPENAAVFEETIQNLLRQFTRIYGLFSLMQQQEKTEVYRWETENNLLVLMGRPSKQAISYLLVRHPSSNQRNTRE